MQQALETISTGRQRIGVAEDPIEKTLRAVVLKSGGDSGMAALGDVDKSSSMAKFSILIILHQPRRKKKGLDPIVQQGKAAKGVNVYHK